ncbi:hypothetical protein BDV39DRAFT_109236 [Aspergillus sergii]|uniref:Secreted protein n=1 Tax=Aspergillus sergii TaxID=1034303 RepID=A0A5N6WWD3_9EURO|nr:hypothetical protein BDV39DRAFT_109236 [Aspergillus sergii]
MLFAFCVFPYLSFLLSLPHPFLREYLLLLNDSMCAWPNQVPATFLQPPSSCMKHRIGVFNFIQCSGLLPHAATYSMN